MNYDLAPVTTAADWQAYHRLRRSVLWDARGRQGYDEHHPDDRCPGHHPLVLKLDGEVIGTVRLDEVGERDGVVRLVAIAAERQRQGHGRRLMRLVEDAALELELRRLMVHAAADAVSFYATLGWSPERWDDPNRNQISEVASEPMVKDLVRSALDKRDRA